MRVMSRKRSAAQTLAFGDSSEECDGYIEYEYYSPGCYFTPQVLRNTTPYSLEILHEYPIQWQCENTATYVVDTYGMVYYLSDFEHQLQFPCTRALENDISYHYVEKDFDDTEEDEGVSPRKRERLENENYDTDIAISDQSTSASKTENKDLGNVYRSKHGYLVEEPPEDLSTKITPKI